MRKRLHVYDPNPKIGVVRVQPAKVILTLLSQFLGHMFVVVNMVLQVAGCGMILVRKYVTVAVGMLFGVIVLQVLYVEIIRWAHSDYNGLSYCRQ